jgi:hypothetical protein
MKQRHDSTTNKHLDGEVKPASRARKIPGIGSRGVGIKVHGDEPFDPYRFQDFEVTPAFRQRILEAPLPLLELRELIADQVPQSQERPRAGANDITQPALPNSEQLADDPVIEFSDLNSGELELLLTPTQPVDREASTAKLGVCPTANATEATDPLARDASVPASAAHSHSPKRTVLIAGALGLLLLGLAFAYLNKPSPVASPQPSPPVAEAVTPPQIEANSPENAAAMPAAEPQKLADPPTPPAAAAKPREQTSPPSQQARVGSSPLKDPAPIANSPAKPSNKQGPAKKTLWLRAE